MTARRLFAALSTAAVISIAGWQIASSPLEAQGGLTPGSPRGQQGAGPFKSLTIRGVMLIDGTGAPPTGPVNITVENNIITRISSAGTPGVPVGRQGGAGAAGGGRGQAPAASADQFVVEAQGMYLMPGFIDMHVHAGGAPKNAEAEYAYQL